MVSSADALKSNLKAILAARDLSGRRFAATAGLTPTQASDYVRGEQVPSLEVIDRICERLGGIQPWELIRPEGAKETPTPTAQELLEMNQRKDSEIAKLKARVLAFEAFMPSSDPEMQELRQIVMRAKADPKYWETFMEILRRADKVYRSKDAKEA